MAGGGSNRTSNKRLTGVKLTDELRKLIREAQNKQKLSSFQLEKTTQVLPIQHLEELQSSVSSDQLDQALRKTALVFTPPPEHVDTPESRKYQQRMERLRNQYEQQKYARLTSNLGGPSGTDDQINVKSMTYAASIGLNMIVAPISFGVFMYFFGGSLLDWAFQNENEIRRVILGVVSGVFMLFVEMILFVIRTHEFDKAMDQKKSRKSQRPSPFGHYSASTAKTYRDKTKET